MSFVNKTQEQTLTEEDKRMNKAPSLIPNVVVKNKFSYDET